MLFGTYHNLTGKKAMLNGKNIQDKNLMNKEILWQV